MTLPADQALISADDHLDIHAMPADVWSARLPKAMARARPARRADARRPVVVLRRACASRRAAARRRATLGARPRLPPRPAADAARGHGPRRRAAPRSSTARPARSSACRTPRCTSRCRSSTTTGRRSSRSTRPNRLILLPDLPSYDPLVAKKELRALRELGHKGAIVSDTVGRGAPLFEDAWAPFWDAAQETGLPIHVHLAGGLHSLKPKLNSWRLPAFVAVVPIQLDETLSGHDLLGHAREAAAREVRDGRGGPRLDPVRDRAARPRAAQVRREDRGPQDLVCCRARSSSARSSPPTRTRASASS